jgi:L-ascorbate metabolism protein UlaG (beta-lactamase superfamily)
MKQYIFAIFSLFTVASSLLAQEKKALQLRWYGHSFFVLETTAGTKIAFDPHAITEYGFPPLSPNAVTISHPHDDHNRIEVLANGDSKDLKVFNGLAVKGKSTDWAKIDEKYKDVRVRSIPSYHDDEEGKKRGKNAIFVVEADGLKFCHLGDIGHDLTAEEVKAIGPVDVLMIPVGGIYTINGEAAKKMVKQIKPRLFIIPMHYATKVYDEVLPPDEFLDGQKNVNKLLDGNVLQIPVDLKADEPRVVLLGWKENKS